ncbi:MAG TPA: hypothetical protein ENN03_06105 [bacterium]|nr:hypothetical protein [bacterium]
MKLLNAKMKWIPCLILSAVAVLVFAGMVGQNSVDSGSSLVLKTMENDIRTARAVLSAELGQIVILGQDNSRKVYRITNGILWLDGKPVLSGIDSFHFEYRDAHENLLKKEGRLTRAVHTVSYILVWEQDNRNRHVNSRIVLNDPDSRESSKVVWAYSRKL